MLIPCELFAGLSLPTEAWLSKRRMVMVSASFVQ